MDFGYNNPSALVRVDSINGKFYLTELLYKTKLTNANFIERLKYQIPNRGNKIHCNLMKPDRIRELKSQ